MTSFFVSVSVNLYVQHLQGLTCGLPVLKNRAQLAFTFDLLDWTEALLLECQVALKDFCGALYFRCPFLTQRYYMIIKLVVYWSYS